MKVRPMLLWFS